MSSGFGHTDRARLLTIETGRNVVGRLFWHVDRAAVEAGNEDGVVLPDTIWSRALSTFPWDDYTDESRG